MKNSQQPESTATLGFFGLALGLMALAQGPGVMATLGLLNVKSEALLAVGALGMFSPLIAAVVVLRFEAAGPGLGVLATRLRRGRVGWKWYAFAAFGFMGIYVVGATIWSLLLPARAIPLVYLPENAQHVVAMVLVPIVEETGWRGFALPRLQRRFGALKASLLLGVAWSVWHTGMFLFVSTAPTVVAVSYLNIVVGSVIFSWVYNRTRGSLLLAMLLHAGVHLNNPYHALPANLDPLLVYTAAIAVAALAMVVLDRRAWTEPLGGDAG